MKYIHCTENKVVVLQYNFYPSPPCDAYMRQWIESVLVQIMACRLLGAKPLSKPMLGCCQLNPQEQTSVIFFYQNFSFMKMLLNTSSAKWRPICPRGDQLIPHHTMYISSTPRDFIRSLFVLRFTYTPRHYKCPWSHLSHHKTTKRHTVHTNVSWPNPKQWVIVHTSDLVVIKRQSTYILSIITRKWVNSKHTAPRIV